jgi:hypothetical protein
MSINWGRREKFRFTSAGSLSAWAPPQVAAVYSISYKQDPDKKPKAHTVLYFGEAQDLSQDVGSINQVLDECIDVHMDAEDLFVFVHPMPGSSRFERTMVQKVLIGDYRPRGNGY